MGKKLGGHGIQRLETAWIAVRSLSKLVNQISHPNAKRLGNASQRLHGDFVFRPFHVSDVVPRQIGFFGKLFLGKAGFYPRSADVFTQDFRRAAT
jgi:hypothetical protein